MTCFWNLSTVTVCSGNHLGSSTLTVCSGRHLGSQRCYSVQWHAFGMSAFLHKVRKCTRRISEKLLKQPAWSTQCSSRNHRRDPASKQGENRNKTNTKDKRTPGVQIPVIGHIDTQIHIHMRKGGGKRVH